MIVPKSLSEQTKGCNVDPFEQLTCGCGILKNSQSCEVC
jgi:hypothetical protein